MLLLIFAQLNSLSNDIKISEKIFALAVSLASKTKIFRKILGFSPILLNFTTSKTWNSVKNDTNRRGSMFCVTLLTISLLYNFFSPRNRRSKIGKFFNFFRKNFSKLIKPRRWEVFLNLFIQKSNSLPRQDVLRTFIKLSLLYEFFSPRNRRSKIGKF